jgi:threonylcarbamoyladenosine tRNA methylthiotransferase MtaB
MTRGVHTASVGCKVSRADAEAARQTLQALGFAPAAADQADVAVVFTCCVTAEAEHKSRRLVRRLAAGRRPVIATGCAAAYRPEQFAAPAVAVASAAEVAAAVQQLAPGAAGAPPITACDGAAGRRTRVTLKVQDGCGGRCSYCAVRLARGAPWSLPLDRVVAAARSALDGGCGELVLSGINLGLYQDGAYELADVVRALTPLPRLGRLRVSSLEPQHVRGRLLEALAHPRVARHLHVPLQSADDAVLAAMRRPYTFAEYRAAVERVRAVMGETMISTDVIVGFPTETEEAFARTLAAVAPPSDLFGRVHVFPYSPRPGTEAADRAPLPREVVRRRAQAALDAAAAARAAAAAAEVGKAVEVLAEDRAGGFWRGYTSRYTRCYATGDALPGQLVTVAVEGVYRDGVAGRIIGGG